MVDNLIMIHKTTPSVDNNSWLKIWTFNVMNQQIEIQKQFLTKVFKPTNKKTLF